MKIHLGSWTIEEILAMEVTSKRHCLVAEMIVDKALDSSEIEEPAILIEIDGSVVTVYTVEGEPWDITVHDLFKEAT